MKSSTKDQAEGTFHQIKGKVKEIAGELSDNPKLEAEGTDEKIAGKVQEKIGQVKKVLGSSRAAYHARHVLSCGCMIHNQDSERHEVFGVKEFKTTVTTIKGERTNENNV